MASASVSGRPARQVLDLGGSTLCGGATASPFRTNVCCTLAARCMLRVLHQPCLVGCDGSERCQAKFSPGTTMNEKTSPVSTGNGKISFRPKRCFWKFTATASRASGSLDLGCGGGRTSPWLHALASRYLGVDYSAKMIEVCRARYPELAFRQGDARRSWSRWATLASILSCSLTMASTPCRTRSGSQILAEVRRVLRDDGWFAFSSHSIEFRNIVVAFDRSGPFTPRGTAAQSQVSAELSSGSSLSGADQRVCNLERSSRRYKVSKLLHIEKEPDRATPGQRLRRHRYLELGWTTRIGR